MIAELTLFKSTRVYGMSRWRCRYVAIFVRTVLKFITGQAIESHRQVGTRTIFLPTILCVWIDYQIPETKVGGVAEEMVDCHFPTESNMAKRRRRRQTLPNKWCTYREHRSCLCRAPNILKWLSQLRKEENYSFSLDYLSIRLLTTTLRSRRRLTLDKSVNFEPSSTS